MDRHIGMSDHCCGQPAGAGDPRPASPVEDNRAGLIRRAFLLEYATIAWMAIEAAVAIGSGVAAHSVSLTAFGLDSVIELASAGVLIWRLTVELKHGQTFAEKAERIASRIGSVFLFALAAYVVLAAGWSLWTRHGEAFSLPGLIITAVAMPIMYVLARRKLAVAATLGSRALRADAVESITCGWLSATVVFGLAVQALTGAWWADSAASLGVLCFLIKEGREAWAGEECCAHN